jgi:hypothetical protein
MSKIKSQNLIKSEQTSQLEKYEPLVLPSEWQSGEGGPRYITTLDQDTAAGRTAIYRALQECDVTARSVVNTELVVTGLTFHGGHKMHDDGEREHFVVVKMTTADGGAVGTNSRTVIDTLLSLLDLYRAPPSAAKPWRLQLYTREIGQGRDGQSRSVVKVRDMGLAAKR